MSWVLDIPTYDTIESLDLLLSVKKEDQFYETYKKMVNRIKIWAKDIKDDANKKEYIRQSLTVLATLEDYQRSNKTIHDYIITSSHTKIENLALKMQLNFTTDAWYGIRNSAIESLWLDKDPKKNWIPGQMALAVLDFVFSMEDIVYMLYEQWQKEWYGELGSEIIKAIFSPTVWWELLKAIGSWWWDLVTDWEPWATYKKVLAWLAIWWWYGIIKSALKWVIKVWVKGMNIIGTKGLVGWVIASTVSTNAITKTRH
jgi:hypothetical protein